MSVVITSTPVVGLPALTGWAQVVHNHSGHLVCAYALGGHNAHNLGRDLADLISTTDIPDAVALHQLILDILTRTRKAGIALQFAAIVQAQDRLIVGAHQGQVLYHRNGATRSLVQAEAEPQLLEGKLLPGTTLVALTQQASLHAELLTQQLNQGWDVDTIVTSFLPSLHDQADSALSALAFVTVTGEVASSTQSNTQPTITPTFSESLESPPPLAASRFNPTTTHPANPVTPPNPHHFLATVKTALLPKLQQVHSLGQTIGQKLSQLGHNSRAWQHNWQHTLPRAKQQMVLVGVVGIVTISLLISGIVWFVHARKTPAVTKSTQSTAPVPKPPAELPVFFDLRLTEPNFLANRVSVTDTTGYFADLESQKVIQLDLTKKQSTVLPLEALKLTKLTDISWSEQNLYFLGSGLNRWKTNATSTATASAQTLKSEGDSDRDGTILGSFGSYLYVLNPAKRNIFRFTVDKQAKVSEPIGWLVNKKGLDFPQLVSMAIDGDVWLTSKTGQVFKFTQGQPVDWQLSGVTPPPDSPIYAVTNDALTKLYLLEPNRHRLLVVDKSGQLLKEITSPTLGAVTSFGVSETLQKAFAVSGSTVYELGL